VAEVGRRRWDQGEEGKQRYVLLYLSGGSELVDVASEGEEKVCLRLQVEGSSEKEEGARSTSPPLLLLQLHLARVLRLKLTAFPSRYRYLLPSLFVSRSSTKTGPFLASRDDPLALQPKLPTSFSSSLLVRSTWLGRFFSRWRTRV